MTSRRSCGKAVLWTILFMSSIAFVRTTSAAVSVNINSGSQYQTIKGYGSASWMPQQLTPAARDEILAELVNEFGINRLRLEPPGGNSAIRRRWEWLNDDNDPNHINWAALNTTDFDDHVQEVVIPVKQKVEARGETFDMYLSPSFFDGGSTGSAPVWLLQNPGEYAEFALSMLLRLKNTHGIDTTYYCILNEAGNNNPFTAAVVQKMIKTLGPKMQAAGLSTKIEFPECICADTTWNYINSTSSDDVMWSYVGIVSYHLYGGNSTRPQIRDFAWAKGLPTGQTEYMGLTTTHLYDDMTLGGNSYWEIYGISSQIDMSGANYNRVTRTGYYWPFRQLAHYVRPGAVRVDVTSSDSNLRPLAFVKNGQSIVVLINDLDSTARTANLTGLASGTYGVCQSVNHATYQELGLQTVGGTGTLTLSVPGSSVLTLYPYPGTNQPPTVTNFRANNGYLTAPASSTTLSAAAQDPELDTISYLWTVKSKPAAATVNLATPNAASCNTTGLTVAGDYAFSVAVSDPTHTVNREVRITVFASNQPPMLNDVHNRNPVMLILPTSATQLRCGAWDLEGDAVTFFWSIVSQPAGANAVLASPTATNCAVSGMTVAGDYVFKIEASDPTHTVSQQLTVPVYSRGTAPTIPSASATPSTMQQPADSSSLAATVNDPDNDATVWWSVKSAPAGATPVFSAQGSVNTMVGGLTLPGTYIFTITAADIASSTGRDVTVTVTAETTPPTVIITQAVLSGTVSDDTSCPSQLTVDGVITPVNVAGLMGTWVSAPVDIDIQSPFTIPVIGQDASGNQKEVDVTFQ